MNIQKNKVNISQKRNSPLIFFPMDYKANKKTNTCLQIFAKSQPRIIIIFRAVFIGSNYDF